LSVFFQIFFQTLSAAPPQIRGRRGRPPLTSSQPALPRDFRYTEK
jgi:hypothetical protein